MYLGCITLFIPFCFHNVNTTIRASLRSQKDRKLFSIIREFNLLLYLIEGVITRRYVAKASLGSHFRYIFPLKLLRFIVLLLVTVLYIPLLKYGAGGVGDLPSGPFVHFILTFFIFVFYIFNFYSVYGANGPVFVFFFFFLFQFYSPPPPTLGSCWSHWSAIAKTAN